MYILAAKTLILCLAFAGVKMYQSKKIEEKLKREREEKLKAEAEKKDEWRVPQVWDWSHILGFENDLMNPPGIDLERALGASSRSWALGIFGMFHSRSCFVGIAWSTALFEDILAQYPLSVLYLPGFLSVMHKEGDKLGITAGEQPGRMLQSELWAFSHIIKRENNQPFWTSDTSDRMGVV